MNLTSLAAAGADAPMSLVLQVECYSGYKADERPVRFQPRARDSSPYDVQEILDQWYGPGYQCFRVRADDGHLYILKHDKQGDLWTLESFRRGEA